MVSAPHTRYKWYPLELSNNNPWFRCAQRVQGAGEYVRGGNLTEPHVGQSNVRCHLYGERCSCDTNRHRCVQQTGGTPIGSAHQ